MRIPVAKRTDIGKFSGELGFSQLQATHTFGRCMMRPMGADHLAKYNNRSTDIATIRAIRRWSRALSDAPSGETSNFQIEIDVIYTDSRCEPHYSGPCDNDNIDCLSEREFFSAVASARRP